MRLFRAAVLTALTVAMSTPLLAHHTAAYLYDVDKPVTSKGTVTEVEWKQPHVLVHLDVRADDGSVVSWIIELAGPFNLKQRGVQPDFVKPGDAITMSVCVAKDGSHTAGARSITASAVLEDTRVRIC